MSRRIGLALGATLLALLTLAGSASAQAQYPPATGNLQVNRTQAAPGEPITITGTQCPGGSTVTVTFDNTTVGTTTARADGTFSFTFDAPQAAPGRHTITASCVLGNGTTRRQTAEITIVAAAAAARPSNAGTLPRTGESVVPMALGGATLVGLGALAVIATRRRRSLVA